MDDASTPLQERGWWPQNPCFGCGPDNEHGLRLRSVPGADGRLVATWQPAPHHAGPPGAVHGGMAAVPMDCHAAWVAMAAFREAAASAGRDPAGVGAVTGEYTVRLLRPTPLGPPVELVGWLVRREGRRAWVEVEAWVEGERTVTFAGTMFEVAFDPAAA